MLETIVGLDKQSVMQRLSFLTLSVGTLLLVACIPNQMKTSGAVGTLPPQMDADASTVQLVETQPVWTAQQMVAFGWPVQGIILSRFGPGESGARNNGIDISAPAGTPIHAAADGIVAYAGDKVAVFGGLVLLNHGSSWVSAYGHAARVDVVRGQKMTKGQVGDTGYASKPKLHFELRRDRVPVNPISQLPPA